MLQSPCANRLLDLSLMPGRRSDARFFNQSNKSRNGTDAQLLHHPATMNFHCLFRSPKFARNLFVQHASNDKLHYFELARRQQSKKMPSFVLFHAAPPLLCGPDQGALDTLKQLVSSKRFGKKINRARFHGLSAHGDIAVTRNKDELFGASSLDECFLEAP